MKIVHYPHPALRHRSRPLTSIDQQIHLHVGKMFELMYEARGLGLAANQVALPYQLLIMNLTGDANQRDQEVAFINPVIVERKGVIEDEEGCLSLPGLYQKVRRAKTVKVHAYNLKGELVEIEASELAARCWQHEVDHLNGVLFIDKVGPIGKLAIRASLKEFEQAYRKAQERGEIPPDAQLESQLTLLEANA
jgi:peptide deformylase